MKTMEERLIATLYDSEVSIDLREHELEMVSVHIGYTALQFVANAPDSILFALQDKESPTSIASGVIELMPGQGIHIGRTKVIQLIESDQPVDPRIVRALEEDTHISRRHAQIDVVSPVGLVVRDLGSTNKTFVKDLVQTREYRRSKMRLVE